MTRILHAIRRAIDRTALSSDQVVLVVLGVHAAIGAVLLGWETYITGHGRFLVPVAWPIVFAGAAVACAAYLRHRASRLWWKASGASLLACYLSRVAVLLTTAVVHSAPLTAATTFAAATWAAVAATVWVVWQRVVTPCPT